MDYQKAIEGKKSVRVQFFETAISAMEELEQYKQHGTLEEVKCKINAFNQIKWERDIAIEQLSEIGCELGCKMDDVKDVVERQNPKPPNWHINPVMENGRLPVCPTCNKIMVRTEIFGRTIDEHCVTCVQAIDWIVDE